MTQYLRRGFTLIELLVVIAIIGVLSSIIMIAVSAARDKGNDAAIRQSLTGARTQAELYYDAVNPHSYSGVCTSTTVNGVRSIYAIVLVAAKPTGATINNAIATAGGAGLATCHDTAAAWAAEAPLKAGGFACVDSLGNSATTSASTLPANDTQCN